MRPQELAQSMKALRIAANFRNSPRNSHQVSSNASSSKQTDEEIVSTDASVSDDLIQNTGNSSKPMTSQKREFKEQLRHQLPIEASEMARIASIFSSKEKA